MKRESLVLIVDDVASTRHFLSRFLQQQSYLVETAASGQEALVRLEEEPVVDLVLLDIMMPKMSGLETLSRIVTEETIDPAVIMITAYEQREEKIRALEIGAHDCLMKPFDKIDLLARINLQLELRRVRKMLRQKARFGQMLNEITRAALETADYQEVLQILADQLGDLFAADGCYITIWDEAATPPVRPGATYGPMREEYHAHAPQPGEATVTESVLQRGEALFIDDLFQTPYLSPRIARQFPARSMIGLPLIANGRKLGAALIAYNDLHEFTTEERERAPLVADQIALALAKAHLLEEEREHRELAETLSTVIGVINSSLGREEVLNVILDQLSQVLTFDNASIMLHEEDSLRRVASRSIHKGRGEEGERVISLSRLPHVQQAFTTEAPVIIADTVKDDRWLALPGIDQIRSWMGIPLIVQGEVIGLLNVSTSRPGFYTARDARVAMMFADQSATAIQNARFYTQLQTHAAQLEQRVEERTQELTEAYRRLQELDRLKSKLIDDISHELRTPVASLHLYLDLLVQGKEERRSHYVQVLRQQMQRLEEMMEGIIQVSQLELMRGQVSFTAVSLNQIVEDIIASQRQRAEALDLHLTFTPTADLPPIWGDVSLLSEMSKHLVENAINYTESGSIQAHTALSACGRCVYLSVEDTGMGIAAADLPHLFDRFYRGEGASQSNRPGVGLGLTVVQEIVNLHRGDIGVESRPGEGTTFTVRLPVERETAVFGCRPPA